jgi:hypothetical protein
MELNNGSVRPRNALRYYVLYKNVGPLQKGIDISPLVYGAVATVQSKVGSTIVEAVPFTVLYFDA